MNVLVSAIIMIYAQVLFECMDSANHLRWICTWPWPVGTQWKLSQWAREQSSSPFQ